MSNFKLKVIKVSIPGESFWLNYIGEDSKYIYGTVANELLTIDQIKFGDLVKLNKQTKKYCHYI